MSIPASAPTHSERDHQGTPPLVGRVFSLRSLALSIAAGCLAVVIAVGAAGGTYALWNASAPVPTSATLTAGTATVAITSALVLPTTRLYPGLTIYGPATIRNTGNATLRLTLTELARQTADSAFASALILTVGPAASAAACSAGTMTTELSMEFVSSPRISSTSAVSLGVILAPGESSVICVGVGLPATAAASAQGQSATTFTMQLAGVQP